MLPGCTDGLKEFSEKRMLMGTVFEIKIFASDESSAKKLISEAFDEISRLEKIFSVFIPGSEISKLNAAGDAAVCAEAVELIKTSKYYSEISDGAFDITVLPLIELWKNSKKEGKMPSVAAIEKAKKLIGSKKIFIDEKNKRISFAEKGMKIDFGGIAKGYAVDRAYGLLKKSGIKTGMVNAGGNMRVWGNRVWKIALQNPRNKTEYVTVLRLKNESVATSGDYERYFFLDKKRVSHIINPLSGYSADKSISATIITENATDADALSTAVFVMGLEKGIGLIENIKNAECLVIDNERKIRKSSEFDKYE